ncbi:MAG: helix-hairpin-helix domain-containing protein [Streptococcaceae bacterium]|jgi:competence protein ComEA|nr:helix-hairpin-helix domain-containing protein [Streptococcaceae bacterium]
MDTQKIIAKLKEHWQIAAGISVALVLIGGFLVFSNLSRTANSQQNINLTSAAASETAISSSESIQKPADNSSKMKAENKTVVPSGKIVVDVKGAVKQPSVYTVEASLRVNDVIQLAGGFSETANQKTVNLAAKISDAQVIYVPSIGEAAASADPEATASGSESTEVPVESAKININTADATQLQSLSGVGQKKAQDIIDYRTQNGSFKTVDDLGNVSGFGPKSLEKLKESVTVD